MARPEENMDCLELSQRQVVIDNNYDFPCSSLWRGYYNDTLILSSREKPVLRPFTGRIVFDHNTGKFRCFEGS